MTREMFVKHIKGIGGRVAAALGWVLLVALCFLTWQYYKHPVLFFWRCLELPILLIVAGLCIWRARRAMRAVANPGRKRKSILLLMMGVLLATLVIGQEAWFRWQQYQVYQGGDTMTRMGQHFVTGFRDFDEVKPLAERGLIGGIYITSRNLKDETAESLKKRIDELQALRRRAGLPPLFVMADQEGGEVSHLSPLLARMPPLSSLLDDGMEGGMENIEARARAYGEQQGREMAAIGVNMNLAPVVDLKIPPTEQWRDRHTRIGQRAIDSDPEVVARVATAYGQGLAASGIQPTAKHFPGLGRVQADTHLDSALLTQDAAEQAADWLPFREVIAHAGAVMMLSHVRLANIDPDMPASLSRIIVQEVLRKKDGEGWNYQGLLITDDLNMGAVYSDGIGRAAAMALNAGVDLILVSYDHDQYFRALFEAEKAWRAGAIDPGREAESAEKLLKYWRNSPGV